MKSVLARLDDSNIALRSVSERGKRPAMIIGLKEVTTEVVVFVDANVEWKPATLRGLLAGLEEPLTGGVQTYQTARPNRENVSLWEIFSASRLTLRNVYRASSAYWNNGDIIGLSGRTMAYKTRCLQTPDFYEAFSRDFWREKYHLKSGDDVFMTNWIRHQGWKTWYQGDRELEVVAPMKTDRLYFKQLVRWSRDTARFWWRDFRFAMRHPEMRHCRRVLLNWTIAYHTCLFSLVDFLYFCYLISTAVSSAGSTQDQRS